MESLKDQDAGVRSAAARALGNLGDSAAVCGKVFGPWTLAYHLFGVENFLIGTLDDPAATREQPLRLPAGVIRTVLVLSFVVAGVTLATRGRLTSVMTHLEFFFILTGLLVGHYFARTARGGSRRTRAMIAHVSGAVGLIIAGTLMWVFLSDAFLHMPPWVVIALCGTVSFYFGSRS